MSLRFLAFGREILNLRSPLQNPDSNQSKANSEEWVQAKYVQSKYVQSTYYNKNKPSFEQATLAQFFVPHAKQLAPAPEEQENSAQEKAAADAMTKVAADVRARAGNGEDFDKLQIEAYAQAGTPRTTVNTKLEKVRRPTLPPQHETVFDLKPGEVSEVFSDPEGAHFIYKMIGKETLPLDDVKTEIRTAISSQRYRDSMKLFQGDVVFSDAYFIAPGKPTITPHEDRRGKRKRSAPPLHDQHE
ncbi:MAG TPA: peptidylprolyl isomerase [Candidatus Sulfotelmatobacter sp.]